MKAYRLSSLKQYLPRVCSLIGIVAALLSCHSPVKGNSGHGLGQDTLQTLFYDVLHLHEANLNAAATKKLARLVSLDPTFIDDEHGSAWYLFGKVLLAMDGPERAFRIWLAGVDKLRTENLIDPYLFDGFVRLTVRLQKVKYYGLATELFYELLDKLDFRKHQATLSQIYAQCAFLLPEAMQIQLDYMGYTQASCSTLGPRLRAYWRSEDPTPSTLVNERLMEHLQRVEYAGKSFSANNLRGFDERGLIYVRLGKPDRRSSYWWGVNTGQYRPHEIWNYDSIAKQLYFFFVDFGEGNGFELVDRVDRAIFGVAKESERRTLYYELAKVQSSFYLRLYGFLPPYDADFEDEEYRREVTPDAATDVLSELEQIPIQVRTARFLEEDRATRLELYFGVRKQDLMVQSLEPLLPTDTLKLRLSITLEDAGFWPGSTRHQTVATFDGNDRLDEEMLLFTVSTTSHEDSFYVSGQVEDWLSSFGTEFVEEANASLQTVWQDNYSQTEKLLKLTGFRTSLQEALRLEKNPLLISDLQLSTQIIADSENPTPHKGDLIIEPYPYQRVDRRQLFYLYFEIYDLELSPDGEARYSIAYEAEDLKKKQSIWSKIKSVFGRKPAGRVELASEYSANTPNPREWIALDLKALSEGEIKLTVTVTDLISGAVAERSTTFDLF
ncbi:MAG: GWxTD domain-containing protein [bacterium]